MTTINPFEPPRTTDLDAAAGGAAGNASPTALDELAAAAPWVRRLVGLSALAIALQLAIIAIDLARRARFTTATAIVIANVVVSILFLRILRWYDGASRRLRGGDASAIGAIVDAQASYLKLAGIVVAGTTAIFVLYLAYGIFSGRWLAWMRL